MLTVQSLLDEVGLDLAAGTGAAEAPLRWIHISELEDPTPWLSGRRADADHRHPARQRRQTARLSPPARRAQSRGARLRHRLQPQEAAQSPARGGEETRLPALRGALLDPVHRDHREGLRQARQRAVRGAAAGHRRAAPARAAGLGRAWPGGDRCDDRLRRRRHRGDPQQPRRAHRRAQLPPRALRRGGQRDPRRSARATSPTGTHSCRLTHLWRAGL